MIRQLKEHFKNFVKSDAQDEADAIASGLSLTEIKRLKSLGIDLQTVNTMSGEYVLGEIGLAQDTELFNQVSERAVSYSRERAAELVSDIDEVTRRDLRNTIAQGLEDNLSMDELSDLIETSYAFSEQRADIIAQTEIARANGNGSLEGMRLARDAGVKIKKVWLPDSEACDDCQENSDAGPIDLDENFPSGDDAPPAHPNCRCDMASEIDESDYNDDSEE